MKSNARFLAPEGAKLTPEINAHSSFSFSTHSYLIRSDSSCLIYNLFADGEADRKSTQEFDKTAYWKKLGQCYIKLLDRSM